MGHLPGLGKRFRESHLGNRLHVPSTIQTGLAARDGLFESGEKTKNLERGFFGLRRLQPLEIPQNGQRILWKSLEKTGGILEKLGEKAWRIPGRRRGLGRRSIEQRERGPRPPPDRQLPASSYPIRWRVSEFLLGAAV